MTEHLADPLLVLAGVLISGTSLGWLAQRVRLPSVTGQIVAGVALGLTGWAMFSGESIEGLQPITHFALALIGVTVGAHLNLRRLRNAGRRLAWMALAEALVTPVLVGSSLYLLGGLELSMAALMATLAISTAPATIVALVREARARGVFVKTLLAAVAINNVTCIFAFEVARAAARLSFDEVSSDPFHVLIEPSTRVLAALALGGGVAVATNLASALVVRPDRLATLSVVSLLVTFGLSSQAELSPLLSCMALGAVQTNLSPHRDRIVDSVFSNFEPAILCAFFTLAGLHLQLDDIGRVGWIAVLLVSARILAKLAAGRIAMSLAGATDTVRRNLGAALIPQAGVAVGLVILIQEDAAFAPIRDVFTSVVLLSVTANEIIGPIFTRSALVRTREVGRDRPRLVDFLQEENIVTGFQARDMEMAHERLVDLLISSHHLTDVDRGALIESIREREAQVSTCLGEGLAVPHGELPEGHPMIGVMAISEEGVSLPTPDGRPVHCMVLLATPRGERDRHLEVLAALARTIGSDTAVQQQLYSADSPAHAYEVLHGDEAEDFNYFLEALDESEGRDA